MSRHQLSYIYCYKEYMKDRGVLQYFKTKREKIARLEGFKRLSGVAEIRPAQAVKVVDDVGSSCIWIRCVGNENE